ncbi:hypothetical protein AYO25_05285 [Candidatus Liberibacter solanacearum]|uniref:Uncharacterized protein n=1 Tax=Candidatus Liberibacter solanacearum TaxID=556287 RepID=A0A1V2N6X1_9HYPH|nr:hypothetical protein AYO25_05285 [Candidatus Liberibacter solanacearum]
MILSSSDYLQKINHKNNLLLLYNLGFGKEYNLMLDSEYIFREIGATLEAILRTNGILLNVYTLRKSNTEPLQSFLDLITILCVIN